MATDKKRIQAYVDGETIPKFRILTALKGYKSMSEYASELILQSIENYESEHGEIQIPEHPHREGGVERSPIKQIVPFVFLAPMTAYHVSCVPQMHPNDL